MELLITTSCLSKSTYHKPSQTVVFAAVSAVAIASSCQPKQPNDQPSAPVFGHNQPAASPNTNHRQSGNWASNYAQGSSSGRDQNTIDRTGPPTCVPGTVCERGQVCTDRGFCEYGCFIDGVRRDGTNPANEAEICHHGNPFAWTKRSVGKPDNPSAGTICANDNECVKWKAISAGGDHTCGITTSGRGMCWGWNAGGAGGDGTTVPKHIATPVTGISGGVSAIFASTHFTCAITVSSGVKCWGSNDYVWLTDGRKAQHLVPTDVPGFGSGIISIAPNKSHTCALTSSRGVLCWGDNIWGQIGDGSRIRKKNPTPVVGLQSGVTGISTGHSFSCAITSSGAAKCWGINSWGERGDGKSEEPPPRGYDSRGRPNPHPNYMPSQVAGLTSGVTAITSGDRHTCALTKAGKVMCWGRNARGQLGDGSTTDRKTPTPVSGLNSAVKAIAAGAEHTCALTSNGEVMCWGSNFSEQLGIAQDMGTSMVPSRVLGLDSISAITAGGSHTRALTSNGKAMCWGDNSSGKLGNANSDKSKRPVQVVGLP